MTKVICSLRVLREQAIEFRIDLIPGTLTNLYPSLSIIMIVQEGLKKQMDDTLSKDLIQCGLTPWKHIYSQPWGMVVGEKFVDYCLVDIVIIRSKYPLSNIEDLFDQLFVAKAFRKIDL